MPTPAAKLELAMDDHGNVAVTGPIGNPFLCYGMLAQAFVAIQKHNDKPKSGLVTAPLSLLPSNGKGGPQ